MPLSYYPTIRKSIQWYKKLGIHVIEMMLFNSYKLYCQFTTEHIHFYEYQMEIIEHLLPKDYAPINRKSLQSHEGTKLGHFAVKCASSECGRAVRKKCRQCAKNHKRKDTMN